MAWYNPTDPVQRNWMLGGLMCLLVVIPYRMYLLAPEQEANATVLTRVENLERTNGAAAVIAARGGDELGERLALYQLHVEKLEELIPAQDEVTVLIDSIQQRARAVNVDAKSLVPEPSEALEFYDRTAYDMSVVGEYHAVGQFLTEIASLSRIVTPVQVDIQLYTAPQEYPELESPVIASFRIETYVLRDRSMQPQAQVEGS